MELKNTILDDISAEIGFTATSIIAAWYGTPRRADIPNRRDSLYIPKTDDAPSHLKDLIGPSAYSRLVKAFGGTFIRHVPQNTNYLRNLCRRQVFDMLKEGMDVNTIRAATGLSALHITTVRRELEDVGVLPVILKEPVDND